MKFFRCLALPLVLAVSVPVLLPGCGGGTTTIAATPATVPVANLTFSNVSNAQVDTSALSPITYYGSATIGASLDITMQQGGSSLGNGNGARGLFISGTTGSNTDLVQGQTIPSVSVQYYQNGYGGQGWNIASGTVTVTSLTNATSTTPAQVVLTLNNVVLQALTSTGATGSFTLNGTVTFTPGVSKGS